MGRRALLAFGLTALGAAALLAAACGGDDGAKDATTPAGNGGASVSGSLNIEGSSTVAPYTRLAIEKFEAANKGAKVTTGEKGSGGGITALIKKEVPLAASSRKMKQDEIDQAKAAGLDPFETRIFTDALVIVVNPDNTVAQLTEQQVAKIFAGEITNWKDVGGKDGKITVYTRNEESGSFSYMQDDVIKVILGSNAKYGSNVNKQQNAPAGLTAVASDKSGIFYAGLGNLKDLGSDASKLKVLAVAKSTCKDGSCTDGTAFVKPEEKTVKDNSYPISRGLYYYSNGDPQKSGDAVLKAYIAYVLSPDGQKLGETLGFVPVK
jgi:phosphate transport system substrate-binding protein